MRYKWCILYAYKTVDANEATCSKDPNDQCDASTAWKYRYPIRQDGDIQVSFEITNDIISNIIIVYHWDSAASHKGQGSSGVTMLVHVLHVMANYFCNITQTLFPTGNATNTTSNPTTAQPTQPTKSPTRNPSYPTDTTRNPTTATHS